jgi:hypothetical protein
MRNLKSVAASIRTNLIGNGINRKIVVIESDDWGTIRMSSKKALQSLNDLGYSVDKCPYNSNDSIESNEDLEALLNVLIAVKGFDGKPALLTANNIIANPDFDKIRASGFKEYFYEPFTETLKKYPSHDKVIDLYRQGISNDLIRPQFHGREHLNVKRWLTALQANSKPELDAFDLGVFSPRISSQTGYKNEYMDALDFDDINELNFQKKALLEGLDLFETIWGFKSESFIAPCYIWHRDLEPILAQKGVKFIQGLINQLEPLEGFEKKCKKRYHYQGQQNKIGQRYLIRNVFFEPTTNPNFDWESDAMRRIAWAFKFKKPAIISSHRLNYIGGINQQNREINLRRLGNLLNRIKKQWPEVEFKSSDQLGRILEQ